VSRRKGENRTPRSCVNRECRFFRVVRRTHPSELCGGCSGVLYLRTAIRRKRPKRRIGKPAVVLD
jgi:hypothetical protein